MTEQNEGLLTPEERDQIINLSNLHLPVFQLAKELVNSASEAQLAKAKPIIEKQERERIVSLLHNLVTETTADYVTITIRKNLYPESKPKKPELWWKLGSKKWIQEALKGGLNDTG